MRLCGYACVSSGMPNILNIHKTFSVSFPYFAYAIICNWYAPNMQFTCISHAANTQLTCSYMHSYADNTKPYATTCKPYVFHSYSVCRLHAPRMQKLKWWCWYVAVVNNLCDLFCINLNLYTQTHAIKVSQCVTLPYAKNIWHATACASVYTSFHCLWDAIKLLVSCLYAAYELLISCILYSKKDMCW